MKNGEREQQQSSCAAVQSAVAEYNLSHTFIANLARGKRNLFTVHGLTFNWFPPPPSQLQYVTISIIPVQSSHCVCGRITQAVYAAAGLRQGQGDPSGHQQRMKTESQPPSQNSSHSKSGSQGLAPSIFVLPGFWQLCGEARSLSCPVSDINKALMTGNGPWYTVGAQPTLPAAHWLRDIHGVVLQECFTLLIIVRSSYKGWCINKDIYQNADSEETEIRAWQW